MPSSLFATEPPHRSVGRRLVAVTDWRSAALRPSLLSLRSGLLTLGAMALSLAGSSRGIAEDWPQWRGPNCTGVSLSDRSLPAEFSPTSANLSWSAEVGDGIGSPCIAAGRIFATAMIGELPGDRFRVQAFDAFTGKPLWQRDFPIEGEPLPLVHASNSYASSTPAADDERVYLYQARLGLRALDAATGESVWQTAIPEPYFVFDWGPGASPVVHGERLFFAQDDDLFPAAYGLNKRTGEIVWQDDRGDMACSYSHPVICETADGPEVVVAGTGKLIGYDYDTGARKWFADLFCRNIKTTPVVRDGVAYVSVESSGITYQWLATADVNGDGKITREEILANQHRLNKDKPIPDAFWKKFERGDLNGDGVLEGDEIDLAFLDPSNRGGLSAREVRERLGSVQDIAKITAELDELQKQSSIQAVRGGGEGDVSKTHVLWSHPSKAPSHIVSPLVAGDRMFLVKQGGIASSFDIERGEPVWERQRIGTVGNYLASPVHGDGKIYVTSEPGIVTVIDDGPELRVLSRNDMAEPTAATPAIADGRLYVRTRTRLYCFAD